LFKSAEEIGTDSDLVMGLEREIGTDSDLVMGLERGIGTGARLGGLRELFLAFPEKVPVILAFGD
jgi:hypothetical protein